MNAVTRRLGLDEATWSAIGPHSLPSAAATVLMAFALLALNRLGGLVVQAPRAFVRLTLVGVWGWVGLGVAAWLLSALTGERSLGSLQRTLAAVGRAHMPLLVLAGVLFVASGLAQVQWPGLVVAWFVVAIWIPTSLVGAIRTTAEVAIARAVAVVAVPYAGWLATVGRHYETQLGHLI